MILRSIVSAVLDVVFPWDCAVCGVGFEGRGPVCLGCLGLLQQIEVEPCCGLCAMPLPMVGSPCPHCLGKGVANFERVVRLGPFQHPLRKLVHQVKYHKRWGIAEELADRLFECEAAREALRGADVIVPVPLHWRRQMARWFNQARVLADRLARRSGKRVVMPVRRVRNTPTQTGLHSHAQRERNLRDAFELRSPGLVAGKHVLIVDDVWTTGSTMQAMARVLKPARPASLSAMVVAAADPRGYRRAEREAGG